MRFWCRTRDGTKYFVTDHNATFSNALLLGETKADPRPPYQLAWLPDADIRTGTSRWIDAFDKRTMRLACCCRCC